MQYTLTRSAVHSHAAQLLTRHLHLTDFSDTCPARMLLAVLFAAAAHLSSVFAIAGWLLAVASAETIRKALHAALPGQHELQTRLNRALVADLPDALRRRPQRVAADLTRAAYLDRRSTPSTTAVPLALLLKSGSWETVFDEDGILVLQRENTSTP